MSVRRLFWAQPAGQHADFAGNRVYRALAGEDLGAMIKNGTAPVVADIQVGQPTEYLFDDDGLPFGDYQFAITSYDETGNESDPYQHPGWAVVAVVEPVDTIPPLPPTGGGIENVS